MIVTAWNNGEHHPTGAGYGFKISIQDRDTNFKQNWTTVVVLLPNDIEVVTNIKKSSFWGNTCRELINKQFGKWLLERGLAPWEKGQPPRFYLSCISENRFRLDET